MYLIVTNRPKCFQDTMVVETGLSDFNKMSTAVMKIYYTKQKPSIDYHGKFKNFFSDSFIKDIKILKDIKRYCQSCVINRMFLLTL